MVGHGVIEGLAYNLNAGQIRSFAVVVVENNGEVHRAASCSGRDTATEMLGAIALLVVGAHGTYDQVRPAQIEPVIPALRFVTTLGV